MMLALVIVAGTAMAQGTNTKPYPGGTYHYSLSGIKVATEGTATIAYGGTKATIQNVSLAEKAPSGSKIYVVPNTLTTLTFDMAYDKDATSGKITVTITDGAIAGCSNSIELQIDVQALPTLDLAIAPTTIIDCQKLTTTLVNNQAGSYDQANLENTIVFTVTPNVLHVKDGGAYTYGYTISLPVSTGLKDFAVTYSGPGTYLAGSGTATVSGITNATNANGVFTMKFKTTTGIDPVTITETLSAANLVVTAGNGTYSGDFSINNAVAKVKTMPSIGSFTIEP